MRVGAYGLSGDWAAKILIYSDISLKPTELRVYTTNKYVYPGVNYNSAEVVYDSVRTFS